MADKKLSFNIGAKDDASKVFAEIGRNAKSGMDKVDDAFDGSESKGKQLASALSASLDEIDAAMKATRDAADVLGRALGPELAAKIDTVAAVQEFQTLGLSVDEVKADVNDLADVIRKADDVTLSHLSGETDKLGNSAHDASKKVGEVHREADQSRSVLANMVGNSTQDLGELGGVAGTAGVAIGQLGEYAVDGNIALGGLAKVAGPMLALGLAVKAVTDVTGRFADSAKRTKEDVDAWTEAIDAGGDAASNYAAKLKDAGKIMADVTRAQSGLTNVVAEADSHWYTTGIGVHLLADALGATADEVKDITPLLAKAGISAQQFANAASDPQPIQMQAQLAAALRKTTLDADDQKLILLGVTQAQEDYAVAQKNGAVTQAVFGQAMGDTNEQLKAGIVAANAHATAMSHVSTELVSASDQASAAAGATQEFTDAIDDTVGKLNAEVDALNKEIDAATGSADAAIAAGDAHDDFVGAIQATIAAQKDGKKTTEDRTKAVKDERDALINSAKANSDLADKQAEASGTALTASQKVDGYNRSLIDNAAFATPAARRSAYEYLIQLNQIPEKQATEILADVDAGRLADANGKLNAASATRTAAIRAEADAATANRILDQAAGTRIAIIRAQVSGGAVTRNNGTGFVQNAGGGDVAAGEPVWVGDKFGINSPSAEVFVPDVAGHVYNQSQIARHANGSPSAPVGGVTNNITINMPAGSDGRDVVKAIRQYERTAGSGWRAS